MEMVSLKTPVSLLQEVLVQQKMPLPLYEDVVSDKPLFPFKCTVRVGKVKAHGYAHTKKEAKHKSAQEALLQLGVDASSAMAVNKVGKSLYHTTGANYVGLLNEHASGKQVPYPMYNDCFPVNGQFVTECKFMSMKTEGRGGQKKQAKQESARLMLEKVKTEDITYECEQRLLGDEGLMNRILQKFEALSHNSDKPVTPQTEIQLPKVEITTYSMEELLTQLRALGHTCVLEVFQRNPYIMVLKIDSNSCAVMGHGETKETALQDLLCTANLMFQKKFSFNPLYRTNMSR